ncbi:MAG: polysaccharide biosynthesis/export family protein [Muribaculaceae bacterium]|nr:polysaccharide biosynthesis/export family protein [Muribaculaceae bacterium]
MTKRIQYFALTALLAVLISGCSTSKSSLTYFEDIALTSSGEFPAGEYDIRIIPDDELVITVTSLQPAATAPYNLPFANPASNVNMLASTTPQQQTYVVSPKGDIDFPILGRLHVAGMTTGQLTDKLTELISHDVIDPVVLVRLVNFRVNVMGEVNNPGPQPIDRERYSILDAISQAGDMTPYGERANVMLIREENGLRTFHILDLNDSKLLESPYFYLKQNDVVVVQPNKVRQDNSKYNQNNSYKLSVISTVVSACSIIASLVIALTVK